MDLSALLGEIDAGGEAHNADAPDLLKDIEQFSQEQQNGSTESSAENSSAAEAAKEETPFSTLNREPMRGVEPVVQHRDDDLDEDDEDEEEQEEEDEDDDDDDRHNVPPPPPELPVKVITPDPPVVKNETIQYANGTRYIGELREGKPHGKGNLYYSNGSRYEGAFENGEKHGIGVHEWTNTVRYEGSWRGGKKEGEGVLVFPDGSKFIATFRDDECIQGQLWKDGVLRHSGGWEPVFQYVPPNSSSFSLHINFAAALEEDSLRLVYQRLRVLQKTGGKAAFFFFLKTLFSTLASNNDKKASAAIQTFLKETFPTTSKQGGLAYRVLRAGEDIAYGLSAANPLSESTTDANLEHLHGYSQYQVITNSITWVLYNVSRAFFDHRAVPRVAVVDLSRVIGDAVRAKTEDDEVALLDGYVPTSAILHTFSFTRITPLLQKLLAVRGILATHMNFGAYVDWVSAVEKNVRPAELRELMLQATKR